MLSSRYIVVQDFPNGKTETVYQGGDALAAQKAFDETAAEGKASAVSLFSNPPAMLVRRPLQEKQEAADRAAEDQARANSAKAQAKAKLDAKRAELAKLQSEIDAGEAPESGTIVPAKPAAPVESKKPAAPAVTTPAAPKAPAAPAAKKGKAGKANK